MVANVIRLRECSGLLKDSVPGLIGSAEGAGSLKLILKRNLEIGKI